MIRERVPEKPQISPRSRFIKDCPYYAKVITELDHGQGSWNTLKVGVFQHPAKKLGEYTRNYHSLARTFFPFEKDGKWYALYSTKYTATRVMSLPDCKDLGGEKSDGNGFCPIEFYVPYQTVGFTDTVSSEIHDRHCDRLGFLRSRMDAIRKGLPEDVITERLSKEDVFSDPDFRKEWEETFKRLDTGEDDDREIDPNPNIGFVSGCVWGDDTSWKIQVLDLSKVHEGVIKRKESLGYIELPRDKTLEEALIRFHDCYSGQVIRFNLEQTWILKDDGVAKSD